jgi:hypothetical protein
MSSFGVDFSVSIGLCGLQGSQKRDSLTGILRFICSPVIAEALTA